MQMINMSTMFYAMPVLFFSYACFRSWLDYKQAEAIQGIFEGYDKYLQDIFRELDAIHDTLKLPRLVKKVNKEIK